MIFCDTSVLVAAALRSHPRHRECLEITAEMKPSTVSCGIHSLAEMYTSLTRLPPPLRLPPMAALALVEEVRATANIVRLNAEEYMSTIAAAASTGLSGAILYDALLMSCARKSEAKKIYTLNQRHFRAVAPDLAGRLLEP